MSKSILPSEMRGVCKVTGYRGRGKSFFASQIENPALTGFFDFEKKGEGIHGQLNFALYVPVTELASGTAGVWDVFIREMEKIKENTLSHVVLDNTAHLETSMRAEAARHADDYARQFGMDAGNIRANRYGGQGGVVNYLISERICNALWAKGVKLITVTSHIKPRWAGGAQVPNSYNIKGADRWDELSILTIIMLPGDHFPGPALVMKEQLGQIEFKDGVFAARRRLPYRLPEATPAAIYHYLAHPANLIEPAPGERPTSDEIHPFEEKLSREQMSIVLAEIEQTRQAEAEMQALAKVMSLKESAVALMEENSSLTIPQLAKVLSEKLGRPVSPVEAKRALNGG